LCNLVIGKLKTASSAQFSIQKLLNFPITQSS
jgi:hypothetical protein